MKTTRRFLSDHAYTVRSGELVIAFLVERADGSVELVKRRFSMV